MTLERLQMMMVTGRMRYVLKRGWLPGFLLKKHYIKIMQYVDDMFGEDADKQFRQGIVRTLMWNKIQNILPMMAQLLATDGKESAYERFRHYFGRDYRGLDDIELIRKEREKLSARFRQMFYKKEHRDEKEYTMENVIQGVEVVLDKPYIPRTISLYSFKSYYEQSQKRLTEMNYGKR